MLRKKIFERYLVIILVFCMILGSLPSFKVQAGEEGVNEFWRGLTTTDGEDVSGADLAVGNRKESSIILAEEGAPVWSISDGILIVSGSGEVVHDGKALWEEEKDQITSAQLSVSGVSDLSCAFKGCKNLKSVSFEGSDTTGVLGMSEMFQGCSSLENYVVDFDTSACLDMDSMFADCTSLTLVDISAMNTGKVLYFCDMFKGCKKLTAITGLEGLDTSQGVTFSGMFESCASMEHLDLSNFDTANARSMVAMFMQCLRLKEVKFGEKFCTSGVVNMSEMFNSCMGLSSLDLSMFDLSAIDYTDDEMWDSSCNKIDTTASMLSGCLNLTYIKAPLKVGYNDIALPSTEGYEWVRKDTNKTLDNLPMGLTESIALEKVKSGTGSGGDVLEVTIVYHPENGGEEIRKNYKDGTTITLEKVKREGYRFDAWYTEPNGAGERITSASTLHFGSDLTLHLYANWIKASFEISYVLNDDKDTPATNHIKNLSYYNVGKGIILNKPVRKGFTFAGWFEDAEFAKEKKSITGKEGRDIILYAKWKENSYSITYNANKGKLLTGKMTGYKYGDPGKKAVYKYTDSVLIRAKETTLLDREGYEFTGWNTKANGSGTQYAEGVTISKIASGGNVTLYAQWRPIEYAIEYVLNDTEECPVTLNANPVIHTAAKAVALKKPVREGYAFGGWYTDPDFSGKKVNSVSSKLYSDITLYAKWTENTYNIAYNRNGGVIEDKKSLTKKNGILYTADIALPEAAAVVRPGYIFTGWNTKKNGTGTLYNPGEIISKVSSKNKGTVTLYAQWKPAE